MAAVRFDAEAFSDYRFTALGRALGATEQLAQAVGLGMMARVWHVCTNRAVYELPETTLDALAGIDGFAKMVVAVDLGERTQDGVRVKGTHGRVEWLQSLREGNASGGKKRALKGQRSPGGRFAPGQHQVNTRSTPGHSSALTLTLTPSLTTEDQDQNVSATRPRTSYQEFVDWFDTLYQQAHQGARPTWGAKQGKLVKTLLKRHGLAEAQRRAEIMLGPGCPEWLARGGRSLEVLVQHFDKLATPAPFPSKPTAADLARIASGMVEQLVSEGR